MSCGPLYIQWYIGMAEQGHTTLKCQGQGHPS
jgi:hypothetical protein